MGLKLSTHHEKSSSDSDVKYKVNFYLFLNFWFIPTHYQRQKEITKKTPKVSKEAFGQSAPVLVNQYSSMNRVLDGFLLWLILLKTRWKGSCLTSRGLKLCNDFALQKLKGFKAAKKTKFWKRKSERGKKSAKDKSPDRFKISWKDVAGVDNDLYKYGLFYIAWLLVWRVTFISNLKWKNINPLCQWAAVKINPTFFHFLFGLGDFLTEIKNLIWRSLPDCIPIYRLYG